jgi:hypothetical protein
MLKIVLNWPVVDVEEPILQKACCFGCMQVVTFEARYQYIYIYIYIYTQEKEKVKTINKLENKPTIKTQPFQERKRTDFFFYGARPPT